MGKLLLVASFVTVLSTAGCVVETVSAPPRGVPVGNPPPPPRAEAAPAPPAGRVVWVAGYWHWTGLQYAWIPGHWEQERPGAVWRAPRYSLHDGTYFYEPGFWWSPPR